MTTLAPSAGAQTVDHQTNIRQRAAGIHHRLDRLVTAAAMKAGWGQADVPRMVHTATVEFFSRLAQHEAPEAALEKAMHAAERGQIIHFVGEAGTRGHRMQAAMMVILQRRLNSDDPKERKAIQFALATFNAMLKGGHVLPAAIDAAREAAVGIMRAP